MEQSKSHILVVDDDPAIRQLMRRYLEWMGLSVVEAHDGQAAIQRLAENRPELVCLDLMLPQSSGFDVCEYIQKQPNLAGIPILIVSARNLPVDRAYAEELGATDYLIKPFTRDVFTKKVRSLLNEPQDKRAAP